MIEDTMMIIVDRVLSSSLELVDLSTVRRNSRKPNRREVSTISSDVLSGCRHVECGPPLSQLQFRSAGIAAAGSGSMQAVNWRCVHVLLVNKADFSKKIHGVALLASCADSAEQARRPETTGKSGF
jgi:hypothetical protein